MMSIREWGKACLVVSGITGIGLISTISHASNPKNDILDGQIKMVWAASSSDHPLKSWSVSELQKLKAVSYREKDPTSGHTGTWKGPEMSLLVDKTIESLPGDQKAQVDLIILKDSTGRQIQLPRSLIVRYPVMLSAQNGGAKLVLPLSSKPRIWEEGLPLNLFQFHDVAQIEFANYHQLYGSLYLKSRKDPLAVRGEKIFVQNCLSCHAFNGNGGVGPAGVERTARKLASASHPQVKDAPQLKSREMKALISYLDAFRLENPAPTGVSFTGK
jgi:hypothetical protein